MRRAKGPGELERTLAQVAALEQLLDVHEATSLEQATRLEQSLREKEELLDRERVALERYYLVSRATNDVIWDWDILTDELLWNDAIYTGFHFAPGAVAHTIKFWYDHIHPGDQERVVAGIHKVIDDGGDTWSDEYQFQLGTGEYATVFDRGHVARDEQGKALRMLGAMIDLTDRKRAEEALQSANEELEAQSEELQVINEELEQQADELVRQIGVAETATQAMEAARTDAERARGAAEEANRSKSEFLASMSHELRTPLNAIGGYVQLIELGVHGPVTPPQLEALERVRRNQQHLLSLINDVLNFAKIEAGRVEYKSDKLRLTDVVADVAPMIEPQFTAKGLTFETSIAPEITVCADGDKLRQVMLNLLSNAVKFTESGGRVSVDATTEIGPARTVALLRVSDTGCGIPPDKQESVFDPFVQVHRDLTRPHEGAGLGLAISRDLARGMGGDISLRSTEGEGSTFILTLPTA
ncbi:MAG TPA: ATP-binding protein [Gemmatimonadaceae bacterium]|nr:ATP-binding protein [Gemmatimonadaceae bacterium]